MNKDKGRLSKTLDQAFTAVDRAAQKRRSEVKLQEVGTITFVGTGTVNVKGLSGVKSEELLRFPGNKMGMAFNLDQAEIGVIMLDDHEDLYAGAEVYRTKRVMDVPVGDGIIGRLLNPKGDPLDDLGPLEAEKRRPVERPAPGILDRSPVTVPLQTGLKVVDALIPIGRGQRELILGDKQTGKTAIALDAIINQKDFNVLCLYCAIGKRASAISKLIDDLKKYQAMEYTTVILSTEEDPPGLQFVAPYAAMSMAEHFMEQGRDVLVIFDDLTRHARAYREASLLLRRPPGREAFPGDIFYIHSRLLERSTHLSRELGGGSLTALPIIETEAQNISAYIPTNLISITDGQIYLSPDLFQKGNLPAVDVGKSVSRVGGKTQLPAYRRVAGDLRLAYSQFEELEAFARFGTRLDEQTRKSLERGRHVREILKQAQYRPMPSSEQIAVLVAVNQGFMDHLDLKEIGPAQDKIQRAVAQNQRHVCKKIENGEKLADEDIGNLVQTIRDVLDLENQE
jgi:F-type H+-transporting ATPase subunit alpha